MAGERNFLRVPPDSTGKRVKLNHTASVAFNNMTVGYVWKPGRNYLLGDGWSFHLHDVYQETTTSGVLECSFPQEIRYSNQLPTVGTTIKDPDTAATIALAGATTEVFVNATNIIGFENPENGVDVDNTGSMNVRFAEGLPQLDAFGKLRTSGATLLGDYIFSNSYLPDKFSTNLSHMGATIGWDQNQRAALLTTDTAAGSVVAHTSNTYHHYFPGSSHLAMMTLSTGDSGKTGLGRSWGLFDFQNGFHFVQKDGRMGVVVKSDVTGATVDKYFWQVPGVGELGWNGDPVDGTGDSQMVLDPTKDNIYWIDVQWLGAGRVRFGTYYNGQRVVIHEYFHGNNYPYPLSATGSLPICFAQRNISATGSSSEMRVYCSAVWTESNIDTVSHGEPGQRSIDKTISATNDVYNYIGTMAPIEKYSNGRVNRTLYYPTNLQVMAFDTTTGNPVKVEIEIRVGGALSGLDFQPINASGATVEYDTAATYYGGGTAIYKAFVDGKETFDLTNVYNNMTTGAVKNFAEKGGHLEGQIASISKASPAVVTFSATQSPFRETIGAVTEGVDRDSMYVYIDGCEGMTEINSLSTKYYLKLTGINTAEVYTDRFLTVPLNSTSFGTYTANSGHAHGFYGTQFYWSIVAKKYFGTNPARVIVKVGWKEIRQ
jgi:hypothetical protein